MTGRVPEEHRRRGVDNSGATQGSQQQDGVIGAGHSSQWHHRRPQTTWSSRLSESFRGPGRGWCGGSADKKSLILSNGRMKLIPPLSVGDIEDSHHLGKVAVAPTAVPDGSDPEDTHTIVQTPPPKLRTMSSFGISKPILFSTVGTIA